MTFKFFRDLKANRPSSNSPAKPSGIFQNIKEQIFLGIIFTLEAEANARVFPFIIGIVTWVQIVLMPFTRVLGNIWGDVSWANYLRTAANAFAVYPLIDFGNTISRSFALYIAVFAIFFGCFNFYLSSKPKGFKLINFEKVIKINKIVIPLLSQTCAFPLMSILFATLRCPESVGNIISQESNSSSGCYSGLLLANLIVGACSIVIYLIYGAITSCFYFETDRTRRLSTGSFPSISKLFMFAVFVKLAAVNALLKPSKEEEYIILALLLILNLLLFLLFFSNSPYYEPQTRMLAKIMSAISLWTVILGFVAKTLSLVSQESPIILWVLGLPLIIGVIVLKNKYDVKLLVADPNNMNDCSTICQQQNLFVELWQAKDYVQDYAILLNCFKRIHLTNCESLECPLRCSSQKSKKTADENSEVEENKPTQQTKDCFIEFIEFNFQNCIRRFPNNVELRANYVLFLEQLPFRTQEMLAQLTFIENLRPTLYFQFFVFRYKLKASGQLLSLKKNSAFPSEHQNANSLKSSPDLYRSFVHKIERCCLAYLKFWTHLIEEKPRLESLKDLGRKVTGLCNEIEKLWLQHQSMPVNERIKLMTLYGNFQKHIMNKSQGGDALLAQAKELLAIQQSDLTAQKILEFSLETNDSPLAVMVLSGSLENMGEILQINTSGSLLFGYADKELLGFNVKTLIPNTFNMHHDTYLERAAQGHTAGRFSRESLVFGLSKQGYLLPLFLSVRLATSANVDVGFVGHFKAARFVQLTGFILTDFKGRIEAISAGIISLFGLNAKSIAAETLIGSYFPRLFEDKEIFLEQGECPFPLKYFEKLVKENSMTVSIEVAKYQHYLMIREYYVFKFVKQSVSKSSLENAEPRKSNEQFEFYLNSNLNKIAARTFQKEESMSIIEDFSERLQLPESLMIHDSAKKSDKFKSNRDQKNCTNEFVLPESNYGEDIKIFRLVDTKVIEPENITEDEEEQQMAFKTSDAEKKQLRLKKESQEESISLIENIKSNRLMKDFITRQKMPAILIFALILIHILFGSSLISCSVEFFGQNYSLGKALDYNNLISMLGQQLRKFQELADANLQLLAQRTEQSNLIFSATSLKAFMGFNVFDAENAIDEIKELAESFNNDDLDLMINDSSLAIYNSNDDLVSSEIVKGLKQILAVNSIIKDSNSTDIVFINGSNAYYSVVNIINTVWSSLFGQIKFLVKNATTFLGDMNKFVIAQIIIVLSITLLAILLFALSYFANKMFTNRLELFLDIATSELQRFSKNCEFFVGSIQTDTIGQANYEDLTKENEGANNAGLIVRSGRRASVNALSLGFFFYAKLVIAIGATLAFSLFLFFSHQNSVQKIISLTQEIGNITTVGSRFQVVSNILLLKLIDLNANVNPHYNLTINRDYFKECFRADSVFYSSALENSEYHSSLYQSNFNSILMNDFCSLALDQFDQSKLFYPIPLNSNCTSTTKNQTVDSFLSNGLHAALSVYQDSIYDIFMEVEKYQQNVKTPEVSFPFANDKCKTNENYRQNCVFNYPKIQQNYIFKNIYLNFLANGIKDLFFDDLENYILKWMKINQEIIFGAFLAVSLAAYAFVYLSAFLRIKRDYFLTQRMVLMVPLDTIRYSMFVKDFFKENLRSLLK